jgi:pimeloyl-ACP methyl ester carboxylesterase
MMNTSRLGEALLAVTPPPLRDVEVISTRFSEGRGIVSYRTAGAHIAPPLVLLHGIGSSSEGYRAQFAGLFEKFRVVAWDAPGYGRSSPLEVDTPGVDAYVEVLLAFLDALGLQRCVLVGSSWGSVIAAAFAAACPGRVRALVLAAPNLGRGHLVGEVREQGLRAMRASGDGTQSVDREAIADRLLSAEASSHVRKQVLSLRDAVTARGWTQAVEMLFTARTLDYLPKVQCPIAIVVGENDQAAPVQEHAQPLHDAVPRARLFRLEGCGHLPKLEAADRFNRIVREFHAIAS